jgi:MFS family permease
MSSILINVETPAFVPLANFLNHGLVETAYVTSMFIFFVGLSPIFWNPIANVYGRRPIYIMSVTIGLVMSVASGKADSYGSLLAFRCLNGFFGGVPLGLGSATVCDMFFVHERGFYMGIYTVTFITGGHIAPIIGGYIETNLSWRWCFYVPAIVSAVLLILFTLTVPETLYPRTPRSSPQPHKSWMHNMLMLGRAHPTRHLRLVDFCKPFQMLRYPSVLLPTLCYAVSFAYGSILFIISSAILFGSVYQYQPQQTGLLLGIPITVGSLIGETVSGGFSDWISERRAVSRGGERKPEDRLLAILPAVFFTPLGIIVEGVCLENMTHWIGAAFGVGLASFGLQITTTAVYTYTAEVRILIPA